jgi:hypothetical protein
MEAMRVSIQIDCSRTLLSRSRFYFVIICFVGVTVLVGAASEIEKVRKVFQPDGRFSAANSR